MPETAIQPTTVAERVAGFCEALTAKYGTYGCFGDEIKVFGTMPGKRYTRVVVETFHGAVPSRSAFCFVDNQTGDILMCDGWKRPAEQLHGTVNTPTFGVEFVGPYGPGYRR